MYVQVCLDISKYAICQEILIDSQVVFKKPFFFRKFLQF